MKRRWIKGNGVLVSTIGLSRPRQRARVSDVLPGPPPPPPDTMDPEGEASQQEEEPQPCSSSALQLENAECYQNNDGEGEDPNVEDKAEEEDEAFIFTGTLHPLLLPNVVRDIVRYVSNEDLKNCRVVCSTWNEEACKILQNNRTVTFLDNEALVKYMDYFLPAGAAVTVHSKFQFYNIELYNNNILEEFMKAFGPNIKNLLLQQKFIPEKDLYRILHEYLTNLESIWLRSIPSPLRIIRGTIQPPPPPTELQQPAFGQLEQLFDFDRLPRQVPPPPPTHGMDLRSRIEHRFRALASMFPRQAEADPEPPEPPQPDPEPETQEPCTSSSLINYVFPNIRHLTIGSYNESFLAGQEGGEPPSEEAVNVTWAQTSRPLVKFLQCLPNLQTVSLSTLDAPRFPAFSSAVLRCLIDAGPVPLRNLNLINFGIEFTSDALVTGLASLQLKFLSSLEITMNPAVDSSSLLSLIAISGASLTKLNLTFQPNYPYGNNFIKLPGEHLQRLRSLSLTRFKWSLGFLENLSSLTTLSLVDMDLGPIFPIRLRANTRLEVLKISSTVVTEQRTLLNDSEVVSRITRAFPNMKTFHLPGATDECLRPIYTDLPYLEELKCTAGAFTDCGISGVPLEVCMDLVETQTFYGINADKFRTDLFIGNMTNLLHLSLDSDKMTDLAVLFGVIRCPKLKSLALKSSHVSDLAVESITDTMGNYIKSLDVLHCPSVTEAGRFFASERYPGKHFLARVREEEPTAETRARLQHRFWDTFNRRKCHVKTQEIRTLLRHLRLGRYRRPMQFNYIQERISELSVEVPADQIAELQRELLQIQRVNNLGQLMQQAQAAAAAFVGGEQPPPPPPVVPAEVELVGEGDVNQNVVMDVLPDPVPIGIPMDLQPDPLPVGVLMEMPIPRNPRGALANAPLGRHLPEHQQPEFNLRRYQQDQHDHERVFGYAFMDSDSDD